jgi:hypothetical protein
MKLFSTSSCETPMALRHHDQHRHRHHTEAVLVGDAREQHGEARLSVVIHAGLAVPATGS